MQSGDLTLCGSPQQSRSRRLFAVPAAQFYPFKQTQRGIATCIVRTCQATGSDATKPTVQWCIVFWLPVAALRQQQGDTGETSAESPLHLEQGHESSHEFGMVHRADGRLCGCALVPVVVLLRSNNSG